MKDVEVADHRTHFILCVNKNIFNMSRESVPLEKYYCLKSHIWWSVSL